MYKALYRRCRPLTFADVVGQEHITATLRREARDGRLSHAYLFTGTRGTGKTTCAKILARAVNCEHPKEGDPCNACAACRSILDGSAMDVIEIDAASHSGVDNIRALREEAVYAPAALSRRVYIIDEVHMLSTGAFNALLTILEEPPPHVLFILATTETHKVPATILSRCQRFAFGRISPAAMAAHLTRTAEAEGCALSPDAASLLSRLADGSLRDGLSLLDQCLSGGVSALTEDGVYTALGLSGLAQILSLADAVERRDTAETLASFAAQYQAGRDAGALFDELSHFLRDLLLFHFSPGAVTLREPERQLAQRFGADRLLYCLSRLQETQTLLPRSISRRLDAELCLIRLCEERLSVSPEALEARLTRLETMLDGAPRVAAPAPRPSVETPPQPAPVSSAPAPIIPEAPLPEPSPPVAAADADFAAALGAAVLPQLALPMRAFLSDMTCVLTDSRLTVEVDELARNLLHNAPTTALFAKSAEALCGHPVEVVFAAKTPGPKRTALDELVSRGGGIVTVE